MSTSQKRPLIAHSCPNAVETPTSILKNPLNNQKSHLLLNEAKWVCYAHPPVGSAVFVRRLILGCVVPSPQPRLRDPRTGRDLRQDPPGGREHQLHLQPRLRLHHHQTGRQVRPPSPRRHRCTLGIQSVHLTLYSVSLLSFPIHAELPACGPCSSSTPNTHLFNPPHPQLLFIF